MNYITHTQVKNIVAFAMVAALSIAVVMPVVSFAQESDVMTGWNNSSDYGSDNTNCCPQGSSDVYTGWNNTSAASDVYTGWNNTPASSDVNTGWDTSSSDVYTGWNNNSDVHTGWNNPSSDVYTGWNNTTNTSSDVYTAWNNTTATPGTSDVYTGWNNGTAVSDVYSGWNNGSVYSAACSCYTSATSYASTGYGSTGYGTTGYGTTGYGSTGYGSTGYGSQIPQQRMPTYAAAAAYPMAQPYYQQQPQYYPQQPAPYYPQPIPSYPQPQPRPTQPISQPSYTTNTSSYCTNGSCNTSVVDNSINGSFNSPTTVTTLSYATPQPIIQYQFPQQVVQPIVYNQSVYCTITSTQNSVQNGQAAYLSWSSNGTSAMLSDGIGYQSANGTLAVRPNTTRTYTLTVYGQGGSNVCSTTVLVNGTAPYVSLSQIPYTGFDFGPIGNAIYWMGLASFAVAAAYLVLYYKGGAALVTGSIFGNRQNHVAMTEEHTVVETPVAAPEVEIETPVVVTHEAHPVQADHSMRDTMSITRGHDGTPRIVINRA